jgi:hypothetical protein
LITEHLAGQVPPWDLAGHDLLIWQGGHLDGPANFRDLPCRCSGWPTCWTADLHRSIAGRTTIAGGQLLALAPWGLFKTPFD